mmetsp:Transcript_39984/g.58798  ORF Transcript_39984/g.58798 Transcript_39984/m.58798 type:complete len:153 (-) Transcript_39984:90-548(-)
MMMNAMRVAGRTSASVFRKRVASSAPLRRSMATYFTEDHEYITVEGDVGTVGITDFAQNQMGEIVSVELPEVGDEFEKGDEFGAVASVKAASDVYLPVGGTITAINESIEGNEAVVNESPQDDGWFVKIQIADQSELDDLLDAAAYDEHCED